MKKEIKNLLLITFFAVLCIGMLIVNTNAADTEKSGKCGDNVSWAIDSEGLLTVTGEGEMRTYSAASDYPWSKYSGDVKNISVGDGVTSVGKYAFYGMKSVYSVKLSDSVTKIGGYAFAGCENLTTVYIGSGMETISDGAFENCKKLVEVINKSSLTISDGSTGNGEIGKNAIEIHSGGSKLTETEGYLFYRTDDEYILVNYIGREKELVLPEKINGKAYPIWSYVFYGNNLITEVNIPNGVDYIGDGAFQNCEALKSVTVGNGTATIGGFAFADNKNLERVSIGAGVKKVGEGAFANDEKLITVSFGMGNSKQGASFLSSVFINCTRLESVTLPENTKSLGVKMFSGCASLKGIEIGKNVSAIPDEAFKGCFALKNIRIGTKITSVGNFAFSGCTNLGIVYLDSTAIAKQKLSDSACGELFKNAQTVIVSSGVKDIDAYITEAFAYSERININGTEYASYSKHAHTWKDYESVREKCAEEGFVGKKCSICELIQGATVPAHNFASRNGSNDEYHWDECLDCGEKRNTATHLWSDGEIIKNATHISKGETKYVCSECGRTRIEVIDEIAEHNYGGWIEEVEAGCESEGVSGHYHCECGLDFDENKNVLKSLTIEPYGHYVVNYEAKIHNLAKVMKCTDFEQKASANYGELIYNSANQTDGSRAVLTVEAKYSCILSVKITVYPEENGDYLYVFVNNEQKYKLSGSSEASAYKLNLNTGDTVMFVYEKDGDDKSGADMARVELSAELPKNDGQIIRISADDIEPTCKSDVVCDGCKKTIKSAVSHSYLEPEYEWSEDSSECMGKRSCIYGCGYVFSEKAVIKGTKEKKAQIGIPGELELMASFNCKAFYTQTKTVEIPALVLSDVFKDVKATAYYAKAVVWAVNNDIAKGTGNSAFSPNAVCSRGQVVTFLWRAAGSPEPSSTENPFSDVKTSAYYYKAVLWAVEKGITSGTGKGKFSPDAPCTRGQVATFLWRSKGCPEPTSEGNAFTDIKPKNFYYKAVLWAVENGITKGTGKNLFSPDAECTRSQIVTLLWRNEQ